MAKQAMAGQCSSRFKSAFVYLSVSADTIELNDDKFWNQIFLEEPLVSDETLNSLSAREIRIIRDGSAKHFATLVYKMAQKLHFVSTKTLCNTQSQQVSVVNAAKVLIKLIPCIYEHEKWQNFFVQNHIDESLTEYSKFEAANIKYPNDTRDKNQLNYNLYLPPGINLPATKCFNEDNNKNNAASPSSCSLLQTGSDKAPLVTKSPQTTPPIEVDLIEGLVCCDTKSSNTNNNNSCRQSILSDDNISDKIELEHQLDKATTTTTTTTRNEEEPTSASTTNSTLADCIINSLCSLLFCPEFTVYSHKSSYDNADSPPDDLRSLPIEDYVWEPGVGFVSSQNSTTSFDKTRALLLKLLLTCISSSLYKRPCEAVTSYDKMLELLTSRGNRFAVPLFASLLNTVFAYRPSKFLPFTGFLNDGRREELVQLCLQVLIAAIDYGSECDIASSTTEAAATTLLCDDHVNNDCGTTSSNHKSKKSTSKPRAHEERNCFMACLSSMSLQADFMFVIEGLAKLLADCHKHSTSSGHYMFGSSFGCSHAVELDQELLIFLWILLNKNTAFRKFVLFSSPGVIELVRPILLNLNENFYDPSKTAFVHISVFNLLILSGERNFGVKLNVPYQASPIADLPPFTGSHADLLIIVFYKIMKFGQKHLFKLFDYLLSIIANISPYLKALSFCSSKYLVELFEMFSCQAVILTNPQYHQLIVFLLETFNNIVQYQFDGNAFLVCTIIKNRKYFRSLQKLPTTNEQINTCLKNIAKTQCLRKELMDALKLNEQDNNSSSNNNNEPSIDKLDSKLDSCQNSTKDTVTNKHEQQNKHKKKPTKLKRSGLLSADLECIDFFSNIEATLSAERVNSCHLDYGHLIESNSKLKQEVTLVATPEINDITLPVNVLNKLDSQDSFAFANGQSSGDGQSQVQLDGSEDIASSTSQRQAGSASKANLLIDTLQIESNKVENGSDSQITQDCSTEQASCVERYKWKPSQEWMKQFKESLPLHTIKRMLDVLEPQLFRFEKSSSSSQQQQQTICESDLIKFIQNGTLVGLLPVPHPIFIRKYKTNHETILWLRACTWGIIFVRSTIWTDTNVRLITVR